MTTPDERIRAVAQVREFLQELTCPTVTPGVPAELRSDARQLLRHYPSAAVMKVAAAALPQWFGQSATSPDRKAQVAREPAGYQVFAEARVGIVQSVDFDAGVCTLRDSATEEVVRFKARDDASRQSLADISVGSAVDYRLTKNGRVAEVSKAADDGVNSGLDNRSA